MLNAHHNHTESYTDLASLNAITQLGRKDSHQALEKVAEQFESMMVRMMMKSMRAANEVFAEGNFLNSHYSDFYQGMFDDQLALSLSKNGGLGVAESLAAKMHQQYGSAEKADGKSLGDYRASAQSAISSVLPGLLSRRPDNPAVESTNFQQPVTAVVKAVEKAVEKVVEKAVEKAPSIHFDGSAKQFVSQLYDYAKAAAEKLGVTAEALLAQSALETGWGKKITSRQDVNSLNLFNIKTGSRWSGDSVNVSTLEVRNGTAVRETANFRVYESLQQSFDDYVALISNSPRYQKAVHCGDAQDYVKELGRAGYATDPEYSQKIINIMNSPAMKAAVASVKSESSP